MKCILAQLVLALSGLVAVAQSAAPTNPPARDPAGFLPVPVAPAESSSAPTATTVTSVSAITNNTAGTNITGITSYILDDKHKLMPGDLVSFEIKEDQTNAIRMTVAVSSELDIPYIGRVSVAGRTCKQLADELKVALEKDYYYTATVVVGLDALSLVLGKVYIFGPVRNPGPVDIPPNETFTAGKAIMKAGGFTDFANPKKVQIIRKTPTGTKKILVNLYNVLKKGMTEEDVTLEPDDYIQVPESGINWGF